MSAMINIGPMVAKIVRDMLEGEDAILDVDTVYAKMIEVYGSEIFESERMLAQIAVRQKIKSHLKTSNSINQDGDGNQLKLLKDDAPATLSVKQKGGGYAYIPLRLASVHDLDAATKAKVDNITNAQTALEKWDKTIAPIRKVMVAEKVTFGEAQKLISERPSGERKRKKA